MVTMLPPALRRPEKSESLKLLLSRAEAAKALNLSERMLDKLTEPRGPLKPVRIGSRVLFSPAALQRWIDAETTDPTTETES